MLRPLRNVIHRAPPSAKYFTGPRKNLSRHQERDELFSHVVEIGAAVRQIIFVAAVRVADKIGIVFEDRQLTLKTFLMHLVLRIIEQVFQNPLTGLVVDHHIHGAGALGRGVLRMTARVEIKARSIFQKDIEKTFGGNELLKQIAHHLF